MLVKYSETFVCLEEEVGLSMGRRCSLKRSLSFRFVCPIYCLLHGLVYHVNKIF